MALATVICLTLNDAYLVCDAFGIKPTGAKLEREDDVVLLTADFVGLSVEQVSCAINEPDYCEVGAPWDTQGVRSLSGKLISHYDDLGYPVKMYSEIAA